MKRRDLFKAAAMTVRQPVRYQYYICKGSNKNDKRTVFYRLPHGRKK